MSYNILNRKYECKICGVNFDRTCDLSRHVKSHSLDLKTYILKYYFQNRNPRCECGCDKEIEINGFNINKFSIGHTGGKRISGRRYKKYNFYNCGICGKRIEVSLTFHHSERICMSCAAKNRKIIPENEEIRRNKISDGVKRNHAEFPKIGPNKGKRFSTEWKNNISSSIVRYRENRGWDKKFKPGYNEEACKIIDDFARENGYNFKHAENGGEFRVPTTRYWVDGYDKERNTVIEYYEKFHETRKERDMIRIDKIKQVLNCDVIILKEEGDIHGLPR